MVFRQCRNDIELPTQLEQNRKDYPTHLHRYQRLYTLGGHQDQRIGLSNNLGKV